MGSSSTTEVQTMTEVGTPEALSESIPGACGGCSDPDSNVDAYEIVAKTPANTPASCHVRSQIGVSLDQALAFGELAKALEAMSASTEDSTVSVKQDESTSTDTETQEMEVPAVASDRIRDQIELSLNDALASGELAKAVEAMVVSAGCSI